MSALRFAAGLGRFGRDERASVTAEFALWLPVLFALLAGAIMFFDMFRVSARAVRATATLGDIVARQTVADDAFLETLLPIFTASLPAGIEDPWVRVTSIQNVGDVPAAASEPEDGRVAAPTHVVLWSHVQGPAAPLTTADLDRYDLPPMQVGDTVILTETALRHAPIGGRILGVAPVIRANLSFNRPRFVPAVVRE